MDEDLFGSGLSSLSDDEPTKSINQALDQDLPNFIAQDNVLFDKTENEETLYKEEIDESMPFYDFDMGQKLFLTKLPNFMSVEPSLFDKETYEAEPFQDEFTDDEGRIRLKLKIENTIRYRNIYNDDGTVSSESNARIVKWSDGSLTLHVGSEIFDVFRTPLPSMQNQLFIKQGSCLVCKGIFDQKLGFKPHSTDSDTHKRVTLSVADRLSRSQKICVVPASHIDPEKQKNERIKNETKEANKSRIKQAKSSTVQDVTDSAYDKELDELEIKLNEQDDDIFSDDTENEEQEEKDENLESDSEHEPKRKKILAINSDSE
ncbi:hypothetical protein HZS_843 [Henneguya salminicola]|nr:hypothetical protein HZS_843 [Henneguya salminicola]